MAIIKNPITIVQNGGGEDAGYQPNADMKWAKSILENDVQEGFTYKVLQMISDGWVYSDLTVPSGGAVKTSDGAYYTDSGRVQHTWDDTNAKIPEYYQNMKLRWVITYYPNEITHNIQLLADVMYICFDSIKYTTSFSSKYMLEYFEHINGANTTALGSTSSLFFNCYSLKSIPLLNTSNSTSFYNMFSNCYSLKSIPQLDTSMGTNFQGMFSTCSSLETIPQLDTSKGTNFINTFNNCYLLQTIPEMNLLSAVSLSSIFTGARNLEFIKILNISKSLQINSTIKLSRDTIVNNIIANLVDLTGQTSQTLTLGSTNLAKLSEEDKLLATSKNWVLE